MKNKFTTKIFAIVILLSVIILPSRLKAQITCPYGIQNSFCERVRVGYETVDNFCNTSCQTIVSISVGSTHFISSVCCPNADIYVGVSAIWDPSTLSWTNNFTTLGTNGFVTCPNGPTPIDSQPTPSGTCAGNLTVTWGPSITVIN